MLLTPAPVVSVDDPRLAAVGHEDVAGADQIAARLAATFDERLDSMVALVHFIAEGREALRRARPHGGVPAA